MPLDGITAKLLSIELSKELAGARIDKINQINAYDVYFRLRNGNQNFQLVVSANPSAARIHITDESVENPLIPLRFCTILRKYLSGGRILSVETPGYERIFQIKIQTTNEMGDKDVKTFLVEIMGRFSNLILLNESGMILDAALHVDDRTSRVREVLPARVYTPPLSQNKNSPEETITLLDQNLFFPSALPEKEGSMPAGLKLEQFLLDQITGFSPLFVQEICFQSKVDPKIHMDALSGEQILSLRSVLYEYLNKIIAGKSQPCLFYQTNDAYMPSDFHAYSFHLFPYKKQIDSISNAMEEFYSRKAHQNNLSQKKSYLVKLVNQKIALINKKMIIHTTDLEECKNMDQSKKYGDLILSNIYRITPNISELTVDDFYVENTPSLTIPLQSNLSAAQNAQKYYKRYNKLKSKFESVSKLLEDEKEEQEYFHSIQISLSNVDSTTDIESIKEELLSWDAGIFHKGNVEITKGKFSSKRKSSGKLPPPIPPRKFLSSDGFEIRVGRNNLQNDQLTLKDSTKDDLWFHIQKAPGTHVIIKTRKETVPESTIKEAAMIAAWYSKPSESAVDTKSVIDYCPVRNVWKPRKSSPGHVLYRDYESILVKTRLPENVTEIK